MPLSLKHVVCSQVKVRFPLFKRCGRQGLYAYAQRPTTFLCLQYGGASQCWLDTVCAVFAFNWQQSQGPRHKVQGTRSKAQGTTRHKGSQRDARTWVRIQSPTPLPTTAGPCLAYAAPRFSILAAHTPSQHPTKRQSTDSRDRSATRLKTPTKTVVASSGPASASLECIRPHSIDKPDKGKDQYTDMWAGDEGRPRHPLCDCVRQTGLPSCTTSFSCRGVCGCMWLQDTATCRGAQRSGELAWMGPGQ